MGFGDKRVHTQNFGDWSMDFHEVFAPDGAYLCTYVELQLDSVRKCRLSLVRPDLKTHAVIAELRSRAAEWIRSWEARNHTGNTDFADL